MNYTNEDVARAAGWTELRGDGGAFNSVYGLPPQWEDRVLLPRFTSSPAACAQWLLPVLEARWPEVTFDSNRGQWFVSEDLTHAQFNNGRAAPTWHEAVIIGIFASEPEAEATP